MSIFFLILGIATADTNPAILLIKIPITNKAKEITCDMAFENNAKWQENPNYKGGVVPIQLFLYLAYSQSWFTMICT